MNRIRIDVKAEKLANMQRTAIATRIAICYFANEMGKGEVGRKNALSRIGDLQVDQLMLDKVAKSEGELLEISRDRRKARETMVRAFYDVGRMMVLGGGDGNRMQVHMCNANCAYSLAIEHEHLSNIEEDSLTRPEVAQAFGFENKNLEVSKLESGLFRAQIEGGELLQIGSTLLAHAHAEMMKYDSLHEGLARIPGMYWAEAEDAREFLQIFDRASTRIKDTVSFVGLVRDTIDIMKKAQTTEQGRLVLQYSLDVPTMNGAVFSGDPEYVLEHIRLLNHIGKSETAKETKTHIGVHIGKDSRKE